MKLNLEIAGESFTANLNNPLDITIPVKFDGAGLTAFGAPAASGVAYAAGDYIGDVRAGGSCNCEVLTFAPHLHGTHTECVGHISNARISVADVFKGGLVPASLVTIAPVSPNDTDETYSVELAADDRLITAESLKETLIADAPRNDGFLKALIIRTTPNALAKQSGDYACDMPPFFTLEAMGLIVELGVQHVLIDTPSVDRLDDDGKLTNHHIYWGIPEGSHAVDAANPSPKTITELIYVVDAIKDGNYLLDLQVAAFMMDAAPSHPILYEVTKND
ncbi:MAG: cyclase family protein [Rickettsiales bacterium]|nr:cyclase family protein [Rickettsiales bacterium]